MNLKKSFIISFLLFGTIVLQAQIDSTELIGHWRLEAFTDIQIDKAQKQRRYNFTADSLIYTNSQQRIAGSYTLKSQIGQLDWYSNGAEIPMHLLIKKIDSDTLHIQEIKDKNTTAAVLVRISEKSIIHYQKALEAQTAKNFTTAFSELQKAAQLNHPDAMFLLGMYYFTGTATTLDEIEASKWIRKAAAVGHPEALSVEDSLRY